MTTVIAAENKIFEGVIGQEAVSVYRVGHTTDVVFSSPTELAHWQIANNLHALGVDMAEWSDLTRFNYEEGVVARFTNYQD